MRNLVGKSTPAASPEEDNDDANARPEHTAGARIAGGATGIPADYGNAQQMVGMGPMRTAGTGPKVRKYRVVVGGFVMQNNCRVALRAGKELHEHQYDIPALKRQGIRLEEIRDEDSEPQAPPLAPLPPPADAMASYPQVLRAPNPQPGSERDPVPPPPVDPPPVAQVTPDTPEEAEQKKRGRAR